MESTANVLVVDDDASLRIACLQTLLEAGFRVTGVTNGDECLDLMRRESFDAVLLDLKMPGTPGMQVLRIIRKNEPGVQVIVITGYGTIEIAVQAMREGAFDFIAKPFTPEQLVDTVTKAVTRGHKLLEKLYIQPQLDLDFGPDLIIGTSPAMRKIAQLIHKVAPTDSTVLIQGETGVGKEMVARTIHRLSRRNSQPFVTVDCGSLVESLFESELFGHVKGSFTGAIETTKGKFELAHLGTMFLDEIANIGIALQARLLRVLQEREITKVGSSQKMAVDVRITSATNRDLVKEIQEGRFREDLYYRLKVVPILVPPLRERRDDILPLVHFFLTHFSEKNSMDKPELLDDARQFLLRYDWPGNVRELKNTIERAVIVCEDNLITIEDLGFLEPEQESLAAGSDGSLAELEREEILRVLRQFDGNKTRAAKQLGINRKTLREKLKKYGIDEN